MRVPEEWRSRPALRKRRRTHRIRPIGLLHTFLGVLGTAKTPSASCVAMSKPGNGYIASGPMGGCDASVMSEPGCACAHSKPFAQSLAGGCQQGGGDAAPGEKPGRSRKQAIVPMRLASGSGVSKGPLMKRRGPELRRPIASPCEYPGQPDVVRSSMRAHVAAPLSAALRSFRTTPGRGARAGNGDSRRATQGSLRTRVARRNQGSRPAVRGRASGCRWATSARVERSVDGMTAVLFPRVRAGPRAYTRWLP